MIIDHDNYFYSRRRRNSGSNKYNGAYYYSKDIVKYFIPNIDTDRNWVTINVPEYENIDIDLSHSNFWKIVDCKDAAKLLQNELNKIDKKGN